MSPRRGRKSAAQPGRWAGRESSQLFASRSSFLRPTSSGSRISTQSRRDATTQKSEEGMSENEISKVIVDAAIEVHRTLGGPGLLEAVYEEALAFELESRGLTVHRQNAIHRAERPSSS